MFKSARSRLRAAVFACAAALGLGAYAATVTGYEDFGDVAGVQLWRTAATDSGVTDFAFAKFAAVAADGTVGETYTQGSSSTGTHWRRWASKYNNGDNSAYYTAPGLVLVYDQAALLPRFHFWTKETTMPVFRCSQPRIREPTRTRILSSVGLKSLGSPCQVGSIPLLAQTTS